RRGGGGGDEVLDGKQPAEGGGIGAGRYHNGSVGCYGAGNFRIQVRLTVSRVSPRIGASTTSRVSGGHGSRPLAEKSTAVGGYIGAVGIAVLHHRDGLACTVDSLLVERIQVIDGLEVRWHQRVAVTASAVNAVGAAGKGIVLANARDAHLLRLEVVHRDHADDGGRERAGDLRSTHVGEVLLALDLEVVDLGGEGLRGPRGRARGGRRGAA